MNLTDLINHYNMYGENEGRKSCSITCRTDLLKLIISNFENKTILELYPFNNPILNGPNVKYFDNQNKEGLEHKCRQLNKSNTIKNIPTIHFYTGLETIKDNFDLIFSSHVIHRELCLITHLTNIYNLLNDNGYYIMIIPDKRYTCDHYIDNTDIKDVFEDYYSKKTNNTIKTLIEHRCYTTHNNKIDHWKNEHGKRNIDINQYLLNFVIDEYKKRDSVYFDIHNYKFTHKTFNSILQNLILLNLIKFKIVEIYPAVYNCNEFFVVLQK